MKELIEVIKKELKNKQEEGGGGGGGGGGGAGGNQEEPLLPGTAELKLIKKMQIRVNSMTRRFHNKRKDGELAPDKKEDLRMIERRQDKAADITRQLHRKLNKED
jgi:hypothetical protein